MRLKSIDWLAGDLTSFITMTPPKLCLVALTRYHIEELGRAE